MIITNLRFAVVTYRILVAAIRNVKACGLESAPPRLMMIRRMVRVQIAQHRARPTWVVEQFPQRLCGRASPHCGKCQRYAEPEEKCRAHVTASVSSSTASSSAKSARAFSALPA